MDQLHEMVLFQLDVLCARLVGSRLRVRLPFNGVAAQFDVLDEPPPLEPMDLLVAASKKLA